MVIHDVMRIEQYIAMALVLMQSGCAPFITSEIKDQVPSPDGQYTAVVFSRADSDHVTLIRGAPLKTETIRGWGNVFVADLSPRAKVAWTTATNLTIYIHISRVSTRVERFDNIEIDIVGETF
jgi:hypothetical protein